MNINKNFVVLFEVDMMKNINQIQNTELKKNSDQKIPYLQKKPDLIITSRTFLGSIDNGSDSIDKGSDVAVWERSVTKIKNEKLFISIIDRFSENANKVDYLSSIKKIGITDFYIFKYKTVTFLLLIGQTILLNNWNLKIKEVLYKFINQIENVDLIDHTYAPGENSRRLHSLGGGLRRILAFSKEIEECKKVFTFSKEIIKYNKSLSNISKEDTSTKTKTILNNLEYYTLLGDEEKLRKQLFAVEKNAKVNYQVEVKSREFYTSSFKKFTIIEITELNIYRKYITDFLKIQLEFNNRFDNNSINLIDRFLEQHIDNFKQKAEINFQNLCR